MTPSVAAPGDIKPSDATVDNSTMNMEYAHYYYAVMLISGYRAIFIIPFIIRDRPNRAGVKADV